MAAELNVEISKEAKTILLAAARKPRTRLITRTGWPSRTVWVGENRFYPSPNVEATARAEAFWCEAIDDLLKFGLAQPFAIDGSNFELTQKGIDYAESIQ